MCKLRPSSKQKVAIGYYVIGALTITLAVVVLLELKFLETRIMAHDAVAEFTDITHEIRRHEKNYFLYKQESYHGEALKSTAAARELFEANKQEFTTIANPQQVRTLNEGLGKYRELMLEYTTTHDEVRKILLEGHIRKVGMDILTTAKTISTAERKKLRTLLKNTQAVLFISVISLSILGAGIFQTLAKTVAHHPDERAS